MALQGYNHSRNRDGLYDDGPPDPFAAAAAAVAIVKGEARQSPSDRSGSGSGTGKGRVMDNRTRQRVNYKPATSTPPAQLLEQPRHSSHASGPPDSTQSRAPSGAADSSKRLSQTSTNSSKTKTHIGPWRLGRTLGRGSSGRVRLAKHCITGKLAAVKIVTKSVMFNADPPSKDPGTLPYGIEREVIIMKLIEHPNVMALYDVWENKGEL